MICFLPAILGAVKGLAGPLIAGAASFFGGERANKAREGMSREAMQFEAAEAQKNRDFQESMSNTAVRRRMQDLEAGGINPILAGKFDAATPSGAMATGKVAEQADTISPAVATALGVKRLEAETELISAQADAAGANADLARADLPRRGFFGDIWDTIRTNGKDWAQDLYRQSVERGSMRREDRRRLASHIAASVTSNWNSAREKASEILDELDDLFGGSSERGRSERARPPRVIIRDSGGRE